MSENLKRILYVVIFATPPSLPHWNIIYNLVSFSQIDPAKKVAPTEKANYETIDQNGCATMRYAVKTL
jgi:hypothetical protein